MKPALPTASVAYGLNGPSATATVDNATPAGLHLSQRKFCPNKWDRLYPRESIFGQDEKEKSTHSLQANDPR